MHTHISHLRKRNIQLREDWNRIFGDAPLKEDVDAFKKDVDAFLRDLISASASTAVCLKLDYHWITQTVFSWKIFLKTYFLDFSERSVPPRSDLMGEDACESCYYTVSVQQERTEQPHIIYDPVNNRYYCIPEGICIEDIVRFSIIRIPGTDGIFAVIALTFKEEGGIKSGKHYYPSGEYKPTRALENTNA